MVLIWLNTAVKLLSILIPTLRTHRCSDFTKDVSVIKIRVAHLLSVLCSPIMCRYVLGSVLSFRIQAMVGSSLPPVICLINVICVCLRLWCPTHIVFGFCLFLFGFYSLSCVTGVANFYGGSILCYHFSILYRLLTLAH